MNRTEELRLAGVIYENTNEALIVTDPDRVIIAVNPAASRILGYRMDEMLGQTPRLWSSDEQSTDFYEAMWKGLTESGQWQGELINRRSDGSLFPALENISAVRDAQGHIVNYVAIMSDISAQKEAEARLEHLAYHDVLTGLPNRALFQNDLEHLTRAARRENGRFAVAILDLDGFKVINDSLGHQAGDEVIRHMGARLRAAAREEDTVARVGGDEFALLLPSMSTPETAALTMQRFIEQLHEPILLEGREIRPEASIGVALFPDDGQTESDLIKAADAAMYEAKRLHHHSYAFHTPELNARAARRMDLEQSLRRALGRNELRLHYQPQLTLASGEVVGVEALLRWQHAEHGLVTAADFIPVAEESSLIMDIGSWVIEQACRQARLWQDGPAAHLRIAINLSGHQLVHDSLKAQLLGALDRHAVDIRRIALELEMTESMLMEEPRILALLQELRDHGLSLALDDFGTGYSSLAQLVTLPVNRLKIAGRFVRDMHTNPRSLSIVRTIVSLGHDLKMSVLAEEVESPAQQMLLSEAGCDEIQGHLIAPAMSAEDIESWLRRSH